MMTEYAADLWRRARKALLSAEALVKISGDDAASRAYYAAFDAVSAAFALEGRTFRKHSEVRAAVHRDWVKAGKWSEDLGAAFDSLWELRDVGDYGGAEHVQTEDANKAVECARCVLQAVAERHPDLVK